MEYLTGHDLYQMFNYGTTFVVKKRKKLNDINVFPVPDGDTGNNLVYTMQTISRESKPQESFQATLESISDSALIGARGNSGVIFAQFVNGLRTASKGKETVSLDEFADMAMESVEHTYSSLSNPVEGTMITVIKEWAKGLKETLSAVKNIKDFFLVAYAMAEQALEKTKEQLAILKKNNVVDSGAMGFVLFLKGVNSYFNKEQIEESVYEEIEIENTHDFHEEVSFRYCTEGLVEYKDQKEEVILETLKPYGDSLIVVMGAKMFRIHIHTNTPELVFQELRNFGKVVNQKVDDMIGDINMKHTDSDTVIVTDSIADIDQNYLKENNVVVIPLNVNVEGTTYFDKITLNNEILFDLIENSLEYPTTATPTIKYINDLFSKLLLNYKNILVIAVSSNLSATFNVIKKEVDQLVAKGKNIKIVDTLTNSVAQGLLVKRAVELLKEGKKIDEIEAVLNTEKEKSEILVCLETFKYAMMSGRLPKAVGKIGMFFGIRPIMSIDEKGKGAAFGFALSQKGITKKIVKHVKKDLETKGIDRYALIHCLNQDLLDEYKVLFTEIIGKEPEYISEVSSATAIHSGKGSVAIGYIKK
ncbi:MAG: DegV family protein [Candidatus Izemoplasmatales bacterium]|jgi:DegV family protein with EDD domain|nr:DegV family protein [Candidatus Izemoplasmatales bacterium]